MASRITAGVLHAAGVLDAAGGVEGVDVRVTLYRGWLNDQPVARAEIEDIFWCPIINPTYPVAPSLENLILPYLAKLENLS